MEKAVRLFVSLARGIVEKDKQALARETARGGFISSPDGYSVDDFLDAVTRSGSAWSYQFDGNRREKRYFLGSNVIGLDFEDKTKDGTGAYATLGDLCADPFIAENGLLAYTTPNSKPGAIRARVLFLLPEVETDGKKFEGMIEGLLSMYPGKVDRSAKDSARAFYGSIGADVEIIGKALNVDAIPKKKSRKKEDAAVALEPGSRNESLFQETRKLIAAGFPEERTLAMILGLNSSIPEPLPEGEVRDLVAGAYGRSTIVANEQTTRESADPIIARLNRRFLLTYMGKDSIIIDERDPSKIEYLRLETFKMKLRKHPKIGSGRKARPLSDYWLDHPDRREYERIVFNPKLAEADPEEYNLFRGFTGPEPADVGFDRIAYHIEEVVANREEEVARYIYYWLAHMIRFPWEKPGFAIVMSGGKGTGKGSFVNIVEGLIGRALTVRVAQKEHLVGKFNSHLANKLLVFSDEAFFAGSKEMDGVIKSLITERTIQIEPKGVDSTSVDSYHRYILATNLNHSVPATPGERRYLVTNLSEKHARDKGYFDALYRALPEELPGFMKFLLELDLSGFNPFLPPETEALRDQMAHSKELFEAWIDEFVESGQIVLKEGRPGEVIYRVLIDVTDPNKLTADVDEVYSSYIATLEEVRGRYPIPKVAFGRELARRFGVEKVRRRDMAGRNVNRYQFKRKSQEPRSEDTLPF